MIPGISNTAEERLRQVLEPSITDLREETLAGRQFSLFDAQDEEARLLGIEASGSGELTVVVTDPSRRLGAIRVQTAGRNNLLFLDNLTWGGSMYASIRILGSETVLFFSDIGGAYCAFPDIFMRSSNQLLFWGAGASAVGCSIEFEGEDRSLAVGDDALISGGVWIRNYDMHAMHDLRTGRRIGRPPASMVLERHVWLGQDAMLLGAERVGMGAIVGARALVKGPVPPRVAVAGTPARVIRDEVSWGRDTYAMTPAERLSIGCKPVPDAGD